MKENFFQKAKGHRYRVTMFVILKERSGFIQLLVGCKNRQDIQDIVLCSGFSDGNRYISTRFIKEIHGSSFGNGAKTLGDRLDFNTDGIEKICLLRLYSLIQDSMIKRLGEDVDP